ncbi:MAG: hypothetical protein GX491_23115 [Chloroflexi bacterium]|nr:hypothetical protein [Chloroflexota bacterium]
MNNSRRVGTFTLGAFLVIAGVLFLINQFSDLIGYRLLLALWPGVLILLGLEILYYCFFNKDERLRYDGGAIFIIMVLSFFVVVMAGIEFVICNAETLVQEAHRFAYFF